MYWNFTLNTANYLCEERVGQVLLFIFLFVSLVCFVCIHCDSKQSGIEVRVETHHAIYLFPLNDEYVGTTWNLEGLSETDPPWGLRQVLLRCFSLSRRDGWKLFIPRVDFWTHLACCSLSGCCKKHWITIFSKTHQEANGCPISASFSTGWHILCEMLHYFGKKTVK